MLAYLFVLVHLHIIDSVIGFWPCCSLFYRSTIRDKIIPHAVSWFTGEAVQGEDFEDLGDVDEEDGDEEDENEDEDEEEDDEDEDDDEEEVKTRKKVHWLCYVYIFLCHCPSWNSLAIITNNGFS